MQLTVLAKQLMLMLMLVLVKPLMLMLMLMLMMLMPLDLAVYIHLPPVWVSCRDNDNALLLGPSTGCPYARNCRMPFTNSLLLQQHTDPGTDPNLLVCWPSPLTEA